VSSLKQILNVQKLINHPNVNMQ